MSATGKPRPAILVVEDDPSVADYIRTALTRDGCDITDVVSSGEEAVCSAAQRAPDLALMDINLDGEIDGVQTAERLRDQFGVSVVYLTGLADSDTLNRAKSTEPLAYLLKPFKRRDLSAAIEMALHRRRLERELRESRQWLATTLRSIGDGVIVTGVDGRVTFVNPVAEELTGLPAAEAIGRSLDATFHLEDARTGCVLSFGLADVLQEGKTVGLKRDTVLVRADGERYHISESAAPMRADDGRIDGAVIVFRDITRIYRAEEALRRANEELERRVAERTAELTRTNARLKMELIERRRLQKEILAISDKEQRRIGQDLHDSVIQRLVGIAMLSQLLEASLRDMCPEAAPDAAKIAQLVSDSVTEIRGLTRGLYPVELESEGLVGALCELAANTERLYQTRCEVRYDQSAYPQDIETATQLYRIVQEAVNNAVKHGKATHIRIEFQTKESHVFLSVSDNGAGMPDDLTDLKGMGMRIMMYRASLVGAALEIRNQPGRGVVVSCRFALPSDGAKNGARA